MDDDDEDNDDDNDKIFDDMIQYWDDIHVRESMDSSSAKSLPNNLNKIMQTLNSKLEEGETFQIQHETLLNQMLSSKNESYHSYNHLQLQKIKQRIYDSINSELHL